jgi:hypothetical protein
MDILDLVMIFDPNGNLMADSTICCGASQLSSLEIEVRRIGQLVFILQSPFLGNIT